MAAIEYDKNKLLLAINGNDHLIMIDCNTKKIITKIINPSPSKLYLSMKKVPGFDYDTCPLVILKDSNKISVVNVVCKQIIEITPCVFLETQVRLFTLEVG